MIVEAVALPAHYTKQMADEYLRLSADIASVSAPLGIPGIVDVSVASPPIAASPVGHNGVTISPSSGSFRSRPPSIEIKFTYDFTQNPAAAAAAPVGPLSSEDIRPPRIKEGSIFGEPWREVRKRLKAKSPNGLLPHWEAKAFIVKHGDFVLQEQFVMQLIIQFQKIWEQVRLLNRENNRALLSFVVFCRRESR